MNRTLSLALLIIGCLLVAFGISASNSVGSDVTRFFTGNPTDRSMWLLLGGVIVAIVGIGGLIRGGSPRNR